MAFGASLLLGLFPRVRLPAPVLEIVAVYHRLRGRLARLAGMGFVASLALALGAGLEVTVLGLAENTLLVAIMLTATSLGLVVPVLADAGGAESDLGQVVIAGASIADFGAIILLSLVFSSEAGGPAGTAILLGSVAVMAVRWDWSWEG